MYMVPHFFNRLSCVLENQVSTKNGTEFGWRAFSQQVMASRLGKYYMSCDVRIPVLGVSDRVRYKPGCTATEDG